MDSCLQSQERELRREAQLFSRYLLDRDPPFEMIKHYITANQVLISEVASSFETAILEFSRDFPSLIPFLDAASGVLRPNALLRRKIYIMAAILEASPRYADEFLPRRIDPLKLIFCLASWGMFAAVKVLIGIPLLFIIKGHTNHG